MRFTISIKENRDFRRAYSKGKPAVDALLAVYVCKNRLGINRLGITVGVKLGCAVVRNRVRRRIREAYRLEEAGIKTGYDVVIVARNRAACADYAHLRQSLLKALTRLGLYTA